MDFNFFTFQSNLKSLMESRGLTCKALSVEIGKAEPTISRYLNGKRTNPDISCIIAIAKYFNVSIDWLLGINGDKFDIMPQEIQNVAYRYSLASPDDRNVVQAVLQKYKNKD